MDPEIVSEVESYMKIMGMSITINTKKGNRASSLMLTKKKRNSRIQSPLMILIDSLNLKGEGSSTKFIPESYKTASFSDRLEILAGLIDTDGHLARGGFDFISKSSALASDVAFIARSLGLKVHESISVKCSQSKVMGTYHRLSISGNTEIVPCRLPRKQAANRLQKKNWLVSGFSIEPVRKGDFYGFSLSGDHLYLSSDFTIHHNSGKSLVIANLAKNLTGQTLIFQPSKEILEQNFNKIRSYDCRASIYSASVGSKFVDNITFATIGSVANKKHLFRNVKNVIIDECHLVNSEDGMYQDFISSLDHAKVLGLTATPYRLVSGFDGAMLKFITNSTPRIFSKVLYSIQNDVLFNQGHLAPLEYYKFNIVDRTMISTNSNGTDFSDASLRAYYRAIYMPSQTIKFANSILSKRNNLLVFCSLIEEAFKVARGIPGSYVLTGDTEKAEREKILSEFTKGKIKCLINVGVLTTGFDYPALEAVLIARSTMSLALYYQIVGRVMRPFTYPDGTKKTGWVVDLGGNFDMFGKIETMRLEKSKNGNYYITNNGRQLTDVPFTKN